MHALVVFSYAATRGFTIEGYAQGTTYSIKYYGAIELPKFEIDSLLQDIDRSLSLYKPESLISLFNRDEVQEIEMDEHMRRVIDASFDIYRLSGGAFDITILPLMELWGFSRQKVHNLPDQARIDSALSYVGMQFLELRENRLKKLKNGVRIDLNGIAQGYSVDVLANYFDRKGIHDYLIELGGEIRTKGRKPSGNFLIEVAHPFTISNGQHKNVVVSLSDCAITTAAGYEKQISIDQQTITHHLNPKTGKSFESSIVSVTVIAPNAMLADGYDNYFMSCSPDEAIRLAESLDGIELYIIYVENNMYKELFTSVFNKYI